MCVLLVLTNSAISRDCNVSLNVLKSSPSVCQSFWRFADGRTSFWQMKYGAVSRNSAVREN